MSFVDDSMVVSMADTTWGPQHARIALAAFCVVSLVAGVIWLALQGQSSSSSSQKNNRLLRLLPKSPLLASYLRFFYASFLKPHENNSEGQEQQGQQHALESFYKTQAAVYDATRTRLLRGREDMLGLLAAQLKFRVAALQKKQSQKQQQQRQDLVWVDIGGGTGYNIEAMAAFVPVESFFSHVYLVDLSPSLCDVARQRFARLGWKNVTVVCQDAREFRLPSQCEGQQSSGDTSSRGGKADLVTMSYSLSMIPDYYSAVDSISSLLSPNGVIGVCDFYVQSAVDLAGRNYTGGAFNRHVNWFGRAFWRAWFDADRVNLEAARRDYLEYRFGTVLSASERNYLLGGIPYYIFVGRPKDICNSSVSHPDMIERLDAAYTESPYLSPANHRNDLSKAVEASAVEIRSKAYESAVVNLSANLPLPSSFYQNHHWRICYNDFLTKHTQFNNEYIYAFTWEDPRVDHRLLNIGSDDVILAITSAGDNIIDYLQARPRKIHAVDLNPNQNHLLELKVASFTALGYRDIWKIFGEGKHPDFRELLVSHLSPHLSSQAFQYWLDHCSVFTSSSGKGLYETGGSRYALKMVRYLFTFLGLTAEVKKLCEAQTMEEQRQCWARVRPALLSKPLNWAVVSTEWFAWKAGGVPASQRNMIVTDYMKRNGLKDGMGRRSDVSGRAIWEYVVDTLDPVVQDTLISDDNYFYFLCLQGQYSRRSHPTYLSPKTHVKLSTPGAFDGLRIHTDEINEVIARIAPESLTIAVVMDSMDWFDPTQEEAKRQVLAFNQALRPGGRILLRSASIEPWYIEVFEQNGFSARRVGARFPGSCIDRVNMYASTWICTKTVTPGSPSSRASSFSLDRVATSASSVDDLQI